MPWASALVVAALLCLAAEVRAEGVEPAAVDSAAVGATRRIELRPTLDGRFVATEQLVPGRRPDPQSLADAGSANVTVIVVDPLDAGSQTLGGLLREAAGLSVRETGGIAGSSFLSLRGSSCAQVPIFLDGVPLASPDENGVDLNSIGLQSIASIEIYRGTAPLVLGSASLGGAVHLRSHSGRHRRVLTVSQGSYGHHELDANTSLLWKDWVFDLRARALRNDGNWSFDDDRGTAYNHEDDRRVERQNNRVQGGGLLVNGLRPLGEWRLRAQLLADLREQGAPGYGVRQSLRAAVGSSAWQSRFALVAPQRQPWWREFSAYWRQERQDFSDPAGDFSGRVVDRSDRTRRIGVRMLGSWNEDSAQTWSVSTDRAVLESADDASPALGQGRQTRWNVAAAVEPTLRWRNLRLEPGVRTEYTADHIDSRLRRSTLDPLPADEIARWSTTVRVGGHWQATPALALRANLARSERTPTLIERFGDRGTVVGNPQLRPESGVQRDLGLVWRPAAGRRFTLGFFDNDAFDLIAYESTSPVSTRPVNVGRADLRGVEVEADFGRYGPFDTQLTLTRMSTRDRSQRRYAAGTPLPGRPGLEVRVSHALHLGPTRLQGEMRAVSDNYLQTGARERVPSRTIFGLDLRASLGNGLLAIARAENLGDTQAYDLWNFPLPGRHFSISLRWEGAHGNP